MVSHFFWNSAFLGYYEEHADTERLFHSGQLSVAYYPGSDPEQCEESYPQKICPDYYLYAPFHLHRGTGKHDIHFLLAGQRIYQYTVKIFGRFRRCLFYGISQIFSPSVCVVRRLVGRGLGVYHLYRCADRCGSHPA